MNIPEVKITVWKELSKTDKVITRTVSTYEGKGQDGKPIYNQWVCRFVGKCLPIAERLKEKDTVLISSGKVENVYDQKKGYSTAVITVFDFSFVDK